MSIRYRHAAGGYPDDGAVGLDVTKRGRRRCEACNQSGLLLLPYIVSTPRRHNARAAPECVRFGCGFIPPAPNSDIAPPPKGAWWRMETVYGYAFWGLLSICML